MVPHTPWKKPDETVILPGLSPASKSRTHARHRRELPPEGIFEGIRVNESVETS